MTARPNGTRSSSLRWHTALVELGRRMLSGGDPAHALDEAAEIVAEALRAPVCLVLRRREDGRFVLEAGRGCAREEIGRVLGPAAVPPHRGARAEASVLINGGGGPWGLLAVRLPASRRASREERSFLEAAAAFLAAWLQRSATEQELRRSEARFRSLIENISDMVWEADAAGVYTYCSPNCGRITGYEPAEVLGRTPYEFMPDDEASRLKRVFADVLERGRAFHLVTHRFRRKDGSECVLECSGIPLFGDDGRLRGFRGVSRDVTDRCRVDGQLAREAGS